MAIPAAGDDRAAPLRMVFVSPRFLFPVDSGGKIRTTQILRGLAGGAFQVDLVSPAPEGAEVEFADELGQCCHRFFSWPERRSGGLSRLTRMRHILASRPVPVLTDRSAAGSRLVRERLEARPDVVVFDFPHADVLAPRQLDVPSVLFTHNVEAEIFLRHAQHAGNPLSRLIWRDQWRKMCRFEAQTLARYDRVVAVSERDAAQFREQYDVNTSRVIPTGVDLDYFTYCRPDESDLVVFLGSMDWLANIDGVEFFLDRVWPRIAGDNPRARMRVVGRAPPEHLVRKAARKGYNWTFTGRVDDVRPHVQGAGAFVIPLRVGGGTRLKGYEAMAMGCPIVSTGVGMEGLAVEADRHYLRADDADSMAQAVLRLMGDAALRNRLATEARTLVQEQFSYLSAAREFERICLSAIGNDDAGDHRDSRSR